MGEVKRTVSSLVRMLETKQKEAKSLVDVIDKLESCLEQRPKELLTRSLDRLLWKIKQEAAARTGHQLVAIIDRNERIVRIGETYDKDSDAWLKRLRSEGFTVATMDELSPLIDSLKSEVAKGRLMRSMEFLKQNRGLLRGSHRS